MKYLTVLIAFILPAAVAQPQAPAYDSYPPYAGSDLGLLYSPSMSQFRIWSPYSVKAELRLYTGVNDKKPKRTVRMKKSSGGTWAAAVKGDQKGMFYTFRVWRNGGWSAEVPDPYAIATGVNGKRAMVIDLATTNPPGWENDRMPAFSHAADAVIYELHVRDATIHASSGAKHKGKFAGLAETGTTNAAGAGTGLDHIREMGVTHVHLLPVYDFLSVDETKLNTPQYNWGYEPLNYNVPEGSYATNPYDGITRIRELKQLVQSFHQQGLRVVMDVVYNHTMLTENSWFNELVPGYYYRQTADGKFSNATACGNETASERPMMRKFIIESLLYWVKEYHIDGFRFDLMGVHDTETMQQIADTLQKVKPGILLYGEGWTAGASPLPDSIRALKKNASQLNGIAVFSDDIRDGIKGSVFVEEEKGFVSGRQGMEASIQFGVVAATAHPQIDYSKVNYSRAPYAVDPGSTVTYAECHDNHVLWDKLALSCPGASETERKQMYKLALSIVLTSQGIPFLHAGAEFLRSKNGNENSYNAGDSVNAINWQLKSQHSDMTAYVKALIQLRKEHPAFRLRTGEEVARYLRFIKNEEQVVAFTIDGAAADDSWKKILVVYNASGKYYIPDQSDTWKCWLLPGQQPVAPGETKAVPPVSCMIFYMD